MVLTPDNYISHWHLADFVWYMMKEGLGGATEPEINNHFSSYSGKFSVQLSRSIRGSILTRKNIKRGKENVRAYVLSDFFLRKLNKSGVDNMFEFLELEHPHLIEKHKDLARKWGKEFIEEH